MNELLNGLATLVPEKYRPALVAFSVLASPYITRAIHAAVNGRGIKGVLSAIWLGTNTPKALPPITEPEPKDTNPPTNSTL